MIGLTSRDRYEADGKIWTLIKKEEMRVYEAIVILVMWFKSLYYLQLIPEVAPLIDI